MQSTTILRRLLWLLLIPLAVGVTACFGSTSPTDKCGFVRGDGTDDRNIHSVFYPGESVDPGTNNEAVFFPCNSRNYIINDGTVKNGNGDRVGDRFNPSKGYTSTHQATLVSLRADWELNQDPTILKTEFAPLCLKYDCWSSDDNSGDANYSTPGWNGMLGENMGPAIDQAVLEASAKFDDTLWKNHDPAEYKKLADEISKVFSKYAQATTGYADDLFCGSGSTSGWTDPDNPGAKSNKFKCGQVRFTVNDVQNADKSQQDQVGNVNAKDQKIAANEDRLAIAAALYGKDASFWLGVQDSFKACPAGATCVLPGGLTLKRQK
jgi:hypothetical protein